MTHRNIIGERNYQMTDDKPVIGRPVMLTPEMIARANAVQQRPLQDGERPSLGPEERHQAWIDKDGYRWEPNKPGKGDPAWWVKEPDGTLLGGQSYDYEWETRRWGPFRPA